MSRFVPLIVFVALAGLLYLGLGRDPGAMPSELVGRAMPVFELPDLFSGEQRIRQDIFEGEVTLLNVWATWCPTCYVEHRELLALQQQGVRIVGMNYKDDPAEARRVLAETGDPYAISFIDRDGGFGIHLGVFGAPETFLVDQRGVILHRHVGAIDQQVWALEFEPLYRQLLENEP